MDEVCCSAGCEHNEQQGNFKKSLKNQVMDSGSEYIEGFMFCVSREVADLYEKTIDRIAQYTSRN